MKLKRHIFPPFRLRVWLTSSSSFGLTESDHVSACCDRNNSRLLRLCSHTHNNTHNNHTLHFYSAFPNTQRSCSANINIAVTTMRSKISIQFSLFCVAQYHKLHICLRGRNNLYTYDILCPRSSHRVRENSQKIEKTRKKLYSIRKIYSYFDF